ncbi:hypothetical protein JCM3765_005317 [Sporobolomyces pararoseus]
MGADAVVCVDAATGKIGQHILMRAVGPVYDVLKESKRLNATVPFFTKIDEGQFVMFSGVDRSWIDALKVSETTGSETLKESWRGIATIHLADFHKGTTNMLERQFGSIESFIEHAVEPFVDQAGIDYLEEYLLEIKKNGKVRDMAKEYAAYKEKRVRSANEIMDVHEDTKDFNPSSEEYDPEADWPWGPEPAASVVPIKVWSGALASATKNDKTKKSIKACKEGGLKKLHEKWFKDHGASTAWKVATESTLNENVGTIGGSKTLGADLDNSDHNSEEEEGDNKKKNKGKGKGKAETASKRKSIAKEEKDESDEEEEDEDAPPKKKEKKAKKEKNKDKKKSQAIILSESD